MKKLLMSSIVLTLFSISMILFQFSCKKEALAQLRPTTCNPLGIYSGTSLSSMGVSSTLTYSLEDNNFAVGSVTPTGPAVSFGGYRSSCDSVILSVYYTTNSCYYLLRGELQSGGTVISGTFENLTTPTDYGTFSMSR